MDILHVLVRCFNEDKWWKFYCRSRNSKSKFLRKYYAFRFMRMAAKNGGYVGKEVTILGKPDFKHDFHGVHINRKTVIGRNVQICPNVILGSRTPGGDGPTICDDVYIGANAVIVGKIRVGKGAKIGAGAIVIDDVPDGATVVSLKGLVLNKNAQ